MLWKRAVALFLAIMLCFSCFVRPDRVEAYEYMLTDDKVYSFFYTSNYGLVLDSYDAAKNSDGRVEIAGSYTWTNGKSYSVGLINKNVFKEQVLTSYYQETTSAFTKIGGSAFYGASVDENFYMKSITNGSINPGSFEGIWVGGDFKINGGSISYIGEEAFSNARIGGNFTLPKKIERIENRAFAGMNLHWFILHDTLQELGSEVFDGCENLQRIILPESNRDGISIAENAFPNREGLIIQIPVGLTDLSPFHLNLYDKVVFLVDSSLTESSPAIQYLKENNLHYVRDLSELSTQEPQATETPAAVTGEPQRTETPAAVTGEPQRTETPAAVTGEPQRTETPVAVTGEPQRTETPAAVTTEPEVLPVAPTVPPETTAEPPVVTKESETDSYVIADDMSAEPINQSSKKEESAQAGTGTATPKQVKKSTEKTAVKKGICYRFYGNHYAEVTGVKRPKSIRKVLIPDTVTCNGKLYKVKRIKEGAFEKCKKISTVTIGDYVQIIGARAFANCSKLEKVSFGKRVQTIGEKVLYKDKKMKKIIFRTKKLKKIGKKCFGGIPKTVEITAAASKAEAYHKLIKRSK